MGSPASGEQRTPVSQGAHTESRSKLDLGKSLCFWKAQGTCGRGPSTQLSIHRERRAELGQSSLARGKLVQGWEEEVRARWVRLWGGAGSEDSGFGGEGVSRKVAAGTGCSG